MLQFNATFLVAMFSFIVFIMIMNKILYKPISKIVNEREGFINSNYAEAKETTEKSENILKERDEKLVQTKTESRKIISDKVQTAHKEAKIQTEAVMKKSREEISKAKKFNFKMSSAERFLTLLKLSRKNFSENTYL